MAKAAKNTGSKKSVAKKTIVKPVVKSTGHGGTPVPSNPKKFSAEYQPSSKAKRDGWAKKNALRDILNLTTGKAFEGSDTNYRKLAAVYLGIPENDVSVRMVMDFRQIQKAIQGGDTSAYVAVNDRAFGRVKQEGEVAQNLTITIKGK